MIEFYSMLATAGGNHRPEYDRAVERTKTACHAVFGLLLDRDDLEQSLKRALKCEDDGFDTANFADLFHSSIGSVRYREIEQLADRCGSETFRPTWPVVRVPAMVAPGGRTVLTVIPLQGL